MSQSDLFCQIFVQKYRKKTTNKNDQNYTKNVIKIDQNIQWIQQNLVFCEKKIVNNVFLSFNELLFLEYPSIAILLEPTKHIEEVRDDDDDHEDLEQSVITSSSMTFSGKTRPEMHLFNHCHFQELLWSRLELK